MPAPAKIGTSPLGMNGAMTALMGPSPATRAASLSNLFERTQKHRVVGLGSDPRARQAPRRARAWRLRPGVRGDGAGRGGRLAGGGVGAALAQDEHVVGGKRARHGDPHRALERARIADVAGGDRVGERLGRGDDERCAPRRRAARGSLVRSESCRRSGGYISPVTTRRSGSMMRAPVAMRSTSAPACPEPRAPDATAARR